MHLGGNRRWVPLCHFPEESLKINRFTCKDGDLGSLRLAYIVFS